MSRDSGFWILGWDLGLGVGSLLLGSKILMDLGRGRHERGRASNFFPSKNWFWILWGPIENHMEKKTQTETEAEVTEELGN